MVEMNPGFRVHPFLTVLALVCLTLDVGAQWLETSIQLPPQASARDLIYNPTSNKIYTANVPETGMPAMRSVSIVDGATNAILTTVEVPEGPRDFCHNTVNNKVYCSNVGAPGPGTPPACTISVLDGATHNVIKTLTAGDEPTAFCYSTNNRKVYWVNEWSHTVSVVDAATDGLLQVIPLGNPPVQPVDICYNPVNERVYTANRLTYNLSVIRDTLAIAVTGDVNVDGRVDIVDLAIMTNVAAGRLAEYQPPCLDPLHGDFDGSGHLDPSDCATLSARLAGSPLP